MSSKQTANAKTPRQATRRPYTRTKLGCRTCKIRKVRCDETWPTCRNCSKTGRRCDGVATQSQQAATVTFAAPLTPSHFGGGELGYGDSQDLDLFRRELVACIVGGRAAWRRLVLQAVHEEPALCHAAIASSALRRAAVSSPCGGEAQALACASPSPSSAEVRRALRHYGRCIGEMRRVVGGGSRDARCVNVVLLCVVICICFELCMDEPLVALGHLEHGLSIVASNYSSVDADLALAFSRLDLQATIFLGLRPPALDAARVSSYAPSPAADGYYQEADRDLTCLTSRLFGFMRTVADDFRYREPGSVPLHVAAEAGRLEDDLAAFRARHLAPGTPFMEHGRPGETALIRVKCLTAGILLTTSLAAEEAIYDRFTAQFAEIATLCAGLLDGPARTTGRGFALDMGVVHSLYVTAGKCRHPRVRRRAVRLLDAVPGAEGAWQAREYARIGERVMQLEECGLDLDLDLDPDPDLDLDLEPGLELSTGTTDVNATGSAWDLSWVPEWRRIHSTEIYPQIGLRRADVFFRRRPNGMDGEWEDFGEVIAW